MKAVSPGERPAPNSYWVVPNRFAAGEYPGATSSRHQETVAKVTALLDAGIDHFIDLTEAKERLNPYVDLANEETRHRGVTIGYERWPIPDMVGGGHFDLQPGQWTDDTSMTLCLATSLVESGGFDPGDQMTRYVRWWREGYLSSTGACFDIGIATRGALSRFEKTGEPFAGSLDPNSAGNGSLMRLAPVPMFFAGDPAGAIERSADSSKTTHGAEEAVDACRYFSGLLAGALKGVDKAMLLSDRYCPIEGHWRRNPLAERIDAVAAGSFKAKEPPEIKGAGYVVLSLEAALWAFRGSTCFRDGALLAVNLGDDADTTGAIYGQIAGAHYGVEAIPAEWRRRLTMKAEIESLADQLYEGAMKSDHRGFTSL